jgi:hypothetical protein
MTFYLPNLSKSLKVYMLNGSLEGHVGAMVSYGSQIGSCTALWLGPGNMLMNWPWGRCI